MTDGYNEGTDNVPTIDPSADASPGERAWVKTLEPRIQNILPSVETKHCRAEVRTGYRLPYTSEILRYAHDSDDPLPPKSQRYETDLLICDVLKDESGWMPRVVIECKRGSVTTHDALTYSTKAATHKHVHPYLRYGILIGAYGTALPPRLVRHGAYFDFMAVWEEDQPSDDDWFAFQSVLVEEIRAGRLMQELLTEKKSGGKKYRLLHRRLHHVEAKK